MAAAEDAANERAQKQHEEALRNKLKANKRGREKEVTTSDDEDASSYEPPKHAKKQKTSVRIPGGGATKGTPEPKNSETFPRSMWPAGMSAQQVNKKLFNPERGLLCFYLGRQPKQTTISGPEESV